MSTKTELAAEYFNKGFACSQAVLAAFCEDYDLDTETALKLSGPSGGGFGIAGLCGAVSGAAFVIGLKYGQYIDGDAGAKTNCRTKTNQFLDAFRAEFGNLDCRELLGFDLSTPEGHAEYIKMVRSESPCVKFVLRAVEILEELGY